MTFRQRILATLNHNRPGRVPIDFAATRSSGIHGIAYNQLTSFLEISSLGATIYDVHQMLAAPEESIRKALSTDVVLLSSLQYASITAWLFLTHGSLPEIVEEAERQIDIPTPHGGFECTRVQTICK